MGVFVVLVVVMFILVLLLLFILNDLCVNGLVIKFILEEEFFMKFDFVIFKDVVIVVEFIVYVIVVVMDGCLLIFEFFVKCECNLDFVIF